MLEICALPACVRASNWLDASQEKYAAAGGGGIPHASVSAECRCERCLLCGCWLLVKDSGGPLFFFDKVAFTSSEEIHCDSTGDRFCHIIVVNVMYHGLSDSHNFSPVVPSDIDSDSMTKPSMILFARGVEGIKVVATSLLAAEAPTPAAATAVASTSSSYFDSKLLTFELSSDESLLSCLPKIKAGHLF